MPKWRCAVTMHSWNALDPVKLTPSGIVTAAFLSASMEDLRSAARYVNRLPYARNSNPADPLIVLIEQRGTCSTKHALIRRLAIEQDLDIALVLGVYEMTEQNTPGVGHVLGKHGLAMLPEAHCYLRAAGKRIDLTRAVDLKVRKEEVARFLYEEDIDPEQITGYKTELHKRFLSQWIANNKTLGRSLLGRSLKEIWDIREECIASLGQPE